MAVSDSDSYYAIKAGEAVQLAWLTRQFYDALLLEMPSETGLPPAPPLSPELAHDVTLSWFEYELAESEMAIDDE